MSPGESERASYRYIFFIIGIVIICGELVLLLAARKPKARSESTLPLSTKAVKTDFDLAPAQTMDYSIGLDNSDLSQFQSLKFRARTGDAEDAIFLRVEFTNAFQEKSEVYVNTIPGKWKEYSIDLSEFEKITDWMAVTSVSFIVEAWNSRRNKSAIYFDKVRLVRKDGPVNVPATRDSGTTDVRIKALPPERLAPYKDERYVKENVSRYLTSEYSFSPVSGVQKSSAENSISKAWLERRAETLRKNTKGVFQLKKEE